MDEGKKSKKKNKNEHKHIRVTVTVEEELYKLFLQEFKDINVSLLLELIMQQALRLRGFEYELAEDEVIRKKSKNLAKKLSSFLKSKQLASRIFSKEILERAVKEGDLAKQNSLL